jgi:hypothetical protein
MKSVTIELVNEAFCKWRAERSSRAESIPENLWALAIGLYPQYKRSIICHRLHLSGSQFKRRIEGNPPTCADNGFVVASRDEIKVTLKPSPDVQLTIQGKERTLTLCVGADTFGQIFHHIGALL